MNLLRNPLNPFLLVCRRNEHDIIRLYNFLRMTGRRNGYGGIGYGGRRQSDFGGPKPVETGKEYDVKVTERSDRGKVLLEYKDLLYLLKMEK
jgi:hypothetical protein